MVTGSVKCSGAVSCRPTGLFFLFLFFCSPFVPVHVLFSLRITSTSHSPEGYTSLPLLLCPSPLSSTRLPSRASFFSCRPYRPILLLFYTSPPSPEHRMPRLVFLLLAPPSSNHFTSGSLASPKIVLSLALLFRPHTSTPPLYEMPRPSPSSHSITFPVFYTFSFLGLLLLLFLSTFSITINLHPPPLLFSPFYPLSLRLLHTFLPASLASPLVVPIDLFLSHFSTFPSTTPPARFSPRGYSEIEPGCHYRRPATSLSHVNGGHAGWSLRRTQVCTAGSSGVVSRQP